MTAAIPITSKCVKIINLNEKMSEVFSDNSHQVSAIFVNNRVSQNCVVNRNTNRNENLCPTLLHVDEMSGTVFMAMPNYFPAFLDAHEKQ